ncbi:hypothetical protein [Blautia sp. Marseille-P3087]|jgi:hypothetical protein|uniref:hypothetical protein n=1 Tax=Blautia sp. Marseille-P3087 TaxID=1917876 RepID=UPI000B0E9B22|nr:hypothetical protein [Blautia sp. Marseille-P3087]
MIQKTAGSSVSTLLLDYAYDLPYGTDLYSSVSQTRNCTSGIIFTGCTSVLFC